MMLIFHSRYVVLYRALFYRTMILVSFLDLVGCEAFSRDELRARTPDTVLGTLRVSAHAEPAGGTARARPRALTPLVTPRKSF